MGLVTSLAEVWIEMSGSLSRCCSRTSLPSRKCGLKSSRWSFVAMINPSLPSRKCGLKYKVVRTGSRWLRHFPRGSVDWNMKQNRPVMLNAESLPSRKCGLKLYRQYTNMHRLMSLPSRKCGLKLLDSSNITHYFGHFPRGSVDWNAPKKYRTTFRAVTSLAEVWIEIGMT